jgi:cell division protein FtsB
MQHRSAKPQKNDWFLVRRGLLFVNLAVFGLIAWGFTGEYLRHRRLKAEIIRLTEETERLQAANFETAQLSRHFAADEAMEREARVKLGLRKPGESVIIVKDTEPEPLEPSDSARSADPDTAGPLGNLRLWWQYFFGTRDRTS